MPQNPRAPKKLVSPRSALILLMSIVLAGAAATLCYVVKSDIKEIIFASVGVFGGAVMFLDWMIE